MSLDDNTRGGAADDGPPRDGSSLRIIQLTDCHLFTDRLRADGNWRTQVISLPEGESAP